MKTKYLLLFIALNFMATVTIKAQTNHAITLPVWLTSGNKNINPATDFLGTTNKTDLVLRTNNMERLRITKNGNLGIGISNPQQKLDVNGNINIAFGSGIYINNTRVFHTATTGNIFAGEFTGEALTTGFYNVGLGSSSLSFNTTGSYNTAVGSLALSSNTTGSYNTAYGYLALLYNTKGSDNTACGIQALLQNSTGNGNTAFGFSALQVNKTGYLNTASGEIALSNNTTGYNNAAFGFNAMEANITGHDNTAMGFFANANSNHLSNVTALGSFALATASNQVRIGNSYVTSIGGYVDWTKISDARVKKNIKQNVPGLLFINKLKPITYNLDLDASDKIVQRPITKDKDGKTVQPTQEDIAVRKEEEEIVYTGFIAQDVEKAAKSLNYDFSGVDAAKNDKDLYGLRYAEFVVPLAKAVQELSAKNDELEKRIEQLEALNKDNSLAVTSIQSNLIQIYPNPVQSILKIEFNHAASLQKTINIYDVNGKLLITKYAAGSTQLDVKQLTAGTYLIRINDESGKELYNGKVIKQ